MNKPYIVCYMMTSIDGRIDCSMTEKLPGVEEYYPLLHKFNFDATLSGRRTAELEMAEKGKFESKSNISLQKELVSKKRDSNNGYDIVVDTNGTLLWKDADSYSKPLLILTSERVNEDYIKYLDERNINYIATGKDKLDLSRAVEILKDKFGVNRLGIVGGATINTAFLDEGLLDEVDILIGAGIDGRASFPPLFNRNDSSFKLTSLKLIEATPYKTGAVLIRYSVQ